MKRLFLTAFALFTLSAGPFIARTAEPAPVPAGTASAARSPGLESPAPLQRSGEEPPDPLQRSGEEPPDPLQRSGEEPPDPIHGGEEPPEPIHGGEEPPDPLTLGAGLQGAR